ncbi:MAG: hypothetical protein HRU24_19070 [Gammaproteobacteria bacterium]|nr:hypothetical protein [Gammaproteobacteria bacterium]
MTVVPPYGKDRGWIWEIITPTGIKLANLITQILAKDKVLYNQEIKLTSRENKRYRCAHCDSALYLNRNQSNGAHFAHYSAKDSESEHIKIKRCPFYTGDSKSKLLSQIYDGEGVWHFVTKHQVASILINDPFVDSSNVFVEKYMIDYERNEKRRPDISFVDINGQSWAIELTNHWMNPSIAAQREAFFTNNNVKVIWLMSPTIQVTHPAIFEFVQYGLSGTLNSAIRDNCHFNAFSFSDAELDQSRQQERLIINVLLPEFYLEKLTNRIESHVSTQQASIKDLLFMEANATPYLTNKGPSYYAAIEEQSAIVSVLKNDESWSRFSERQRSKLEKDTGSFISCMHTIIEGYKHQLSDSNITIKKIKSIKSMAIKEFDSLINRAPYKEQLRIFKVEYIRNIDKRIKIQRDIDHSVIHSELIELTDRITNCSIDAIETIEQEINCILNEWRENDAQQQIAQLHALLCDHKHNLVCELVPTFGSISNLSERYNVDINYVETLRDWYRLYQDRIKISPNEYILRYITNKLHDMIADFVKTFANEIRSLNGKPLSEKHLIVNNALVYCKRLVPLL